MGLRENHPCTRAYVQQNIFVDIFSLRSHTMRVGEKNQITYWVWAETIARVNNDKTHLSSISVRMLACKKTVLWIIRFFVHSTQFFHRYKSKNHDIV